MDCQPGFGKVSNRGIILPKEPTMPPPHVPNGFTTDIKPWEDSLRAIPSFFNYDWWYFDAILVDENKNILVDENKNKYTCVIIFFSNTPPFSGPEGVHPVVLLTLGKPNGKYVQIETPYLETDFHQLPGNNPLNLKIGNNSAIGDPSDPLKNITIKAQGTGHVYKGTTKTGESEEISVDLVFEAILPAFRIGPPPVAIPKFTIDQVFMPSGTAKGTITIDSNTIKVAGSCYHDHQWGKRKITDFPFSGNLAAHITDEAAEAVFTAMEASPESKTNNTDDILAAYWYWGHFTAGKYSAAFSLIYYFDLATFKFKFSPEVSGLILGKGSNFISVNQASQNLKMQLPENMNPSGNMNPSKPFDPWVLSWNNTPSPDTGITQDSTTLLNDITAIFTDPKIIDSNKSEKNYARYGSPIILNGQINGVDLNNIEGDVIWEYFPLYKTI